MTRNKDFEDGMKFLFKVCKEQGIDIRKYPWIADLSKILSEHSVCYKFWFYSYTQDRLTNILSCCTIDDILYGQTALFVWNATQEGNDFWRSLLVFKLFNGYEDYTLDKINLVK